MFMSLMEIHPEATEFVYVGDNIEKDFYHPRRLGWHTIGIRDTEGVNIHPQDLSKPAEYLPDEWK